MVSSPMAGGKSRGRSFRMCGPLRLRLLHRLERKHPEGGSGEPRTAVSVLSVHSSTSPVAIVGEAERQITKEGGRGGFPPSETGL